LSDEKKIDISAKPFFRTDLRVPAKWQYQKKERNGYHIYYNSKLTGQTPGRWRQANTNE